MKLKRIVIENFKGVGVREPLVIDFTSRSNGSVRPLTCLIGDNGSGKTTILQAIAFVMSYATRKVEREADFYWPGFLSERVSSLGSTRIEMKIIVDDEELNAFQEVYREWYFSQPPPYQDQHRRDIPEPAHEIDLIYENGVLSCDQGFAAMIQLCGRYYVKTLIRTRPELRSYFAQLGDVFWFDQYRNLGSSMSSGQPSNGNGATPSAGWEVGVELLREYLVGMWGFHKSAKRGRGQDYIEPLEQLFSELFPGTIFRGIEPRENVASPRPSDFYFLLEREGKVYDLAEMASGEQSVFALLYNFVRLQIAKSVVLIDEIELHLHPPGQQALVGMLRKIGPDCQFIITTHSRSVEGMIPDDHEVRLEGGRRCL